MMPELLDTLPQPNRAFRWAQAIQAAPPALVCSALEPFVDHLFTTRRWMLGQAAAGYGAWGDVATALNVDPSRLVRVRQVHGAAVVVHRAGEKPPAPLLEADIIVTNDASVAIAVQSADCVPLLLVDRRGGAVGAAHAGWRGLAAGVPSAAVNALRREFGSRPDDVMVAMGPSISGPNYEVRVEVREQFVRAGFPEAALSRWFAPGERAGHSYFDLWRTARDQLASAGVRPDQIFSAALCTADHPDLLCSYRRDGVAAGRMAAAIRCRPRRP